MEFTMIKIQKKNIAIAFIFLLIFIADFTICFGDNKPLVDDAMRHIKWGADPNEKDENSISPLHLAVSKGHIQVVKLLLANNAIVNTKDSRAMTPLYYAKDKEIAKLPTIEWVSIPSGSFKMGDNFNEGSSAEKPVHEVYLSSYSISKYEVTFEQYDKFCDATGRTKPSDEGWGRGKRPVIHVTWDDAKAFCDWLSSQTGESIHLPTEAQWEKAARGTDQRRYPWGNGAPNSSLANYNNQVGKTMPVGSYPNGKSPFGVHDMAGNVWEWCSDWYSSTYYSVSPGSNPQGHSSGSDRVLRGGFWSRNAYLLRSAYRASGYPSDQYGSVGFRLCKD
jgi:formylglycine-generating enzyme required for sulfatase activity